MAAMNLNSTQRRDLIILLCRVAMADGVVVDSERARLVSALARLADGCVSPEEMNAWLIGGPPGISGLLPARSKDLFFEEAMAVVSADDGVDPHEMRAVRDALRTCFHN
jgi:uncharacterized tellurite resistance protein B-like protein